MVFLPVSRRCITLPGIKPEEQKDREPSPHVSTLPIFQTPNYNKAPKYVDGCLMNETLTIAGENCILASPQCPNNCRFHLLPQTNDEILRPS